MLDPETIKLQTALAQYCRDGEEISLEGARPDRLPHYRRLVYNVMYGLLSKAYPIARSILSEDEFRELLDDFLIRNNAQTPEVWKVPGEFYEFVAGHRPPMTIQYPYLIDLLHMEWTEILVFNEPEREVKPFTAEFPKPGQGVRLNPDHRIIPLEYPVHKGDWKEISNKKSEYYLAVYRHQQTKKVHFVAITGLHMILLDCFLDGLSLENSAQTAVKLFNLPVEENNLKLLYNFSKAQFDEGLILGVALNQ